MTSKPIDEEEIAKKEKETKEKTQKMTNLLSGDTVPATASITAGGYVADDSNAKIRKNTLRLGDR